jgi:hypothetical protein
MRSAIAFLLIFLLSRLPVQAQTYTYNFTVPTTRFTVPSDMGSTVRGSLVVRQTNEGSELVSAHVVTTPGTDGYFEFSGAEYSEANVLGVGLANNSAVISFTQGDNFLMLFFGYLDSPPLSSSTPFAVASEQTPYGTRWTSAATAAPGLYITQVSTRSYDYLLNQHSFVSTDPITITARTTPWADVYWSVTGYGAADGVTGFPTHELRPADWDGVSTFTFTPRENSYFVSLRHAFWRLGSFLPNPPLAFNVVATTTIDGSTYTDSLSTSNAGQLVQDETDCLRQEYIDFEFASIPSRDRVVTPSRVGFNTGNYSVQLDESMERKFKTILESYHGSRFTYKGRQLTVPNDAAIRITSAYRNPRRNVAIGSLFPKTSKHTLGQAFDLQPEQILVTIDGRVVKIGRDYLNQPLLEAARKAGRALVEEGNNPNVTIAKADHIHVQWEKE